MDKYILGQSRIKYLSEESNEIKLNLYLKDNKSCENTNIYGTVYDNNKTPVDNCKISFYSLDRKAIGGVYTSNDGLYSFNNVTLGDEIIMMISKDGYTTTSDYINCNQNKLRKNITVTPSLDEYTISGHIKGRYYRCIDNALITLFKKKSDKYTYYKCTLSNIYGQFIFDNVEKGEYKLIINESEYQNIEDNIVINNDSPNIIPIKYFVKTRSNNWG
jgi:hypothetical protein